MNAAALLATVAAVVPAIQDAADVRAVRGIASAVEFRAAGARIRAIATQSITAPIVVRVAEATLEADGQTKYRVEFIGAVAGMHDLRPLLEREDGSPLDLPPLNVEVLSQLTPNHGTDLFSSAETPILRPTLYRAGMIVLIAAWVAAPVAYGMVKLAQRKKAEPAAPPPPPPSFADQLRPLVQSALRGAISVTDRGRLELLLYLYWRKQLNLDGRQAEVIAQLRNDPEAGKLLRSVERWLHGRRDESAPIDGDVASLLEPYRRAPAIETPGGGA